MNTRTLLVLLIVLNFTSNIFSQNNFKMPKEDWSLEINLDGFEIKKEGFSPDETMFQLSAINEKKQINLSIFIEKTESKGDKEECREFYWNKAKNSPLAKENLKKYETDNLASIEHDTKEYNGQIVNFHSLNAYLAKNGYWIDVHISKAGFTKKDKKTFIKLTESITFK
jgi:hypothetical protein